MLEPAFLIPCHGDEECEAIWLIPVSELKQTLRDTGTTTLRGLAESFTCAECQEKFEAMFTLTLNDQSELQ